MDCTWNEPGVNPYRGGVPAAVERYNLSPAIKFELVEKARQVRPDAILTITRDEAVSTTGDKFTLTDMHYGKNTKCVGEVKRDKWKDGHVEYALVYCAQGTCIAVPLICHNVVLLNPVDPLRNVPRISDNTWKQHIEKEKTQPLVKYYTPHNTVPEPSSLALMVTALAGLAFVRRKKGYQYG